MKEHALSCVKVVAQGLNHAHGLESDAGCCNPALAPTKREALNKRFCMELSVSQTPQDGTNKIVYFTEL